MNKEFVHPDTTNTIVTTYKGFLLNSCDMDIGGLTVSPGIPDGWEIEDPESGETLAVTKTRIAADVLVENLQHDVLVGEPAFDCREWSI